MKEKVFWKGKVIYVEVIRFRNEIDMFVGSVLVYMYVRCGSM